MGLQAYLIKRTAYSFVLLFFVLVLNFVIFQLMPGDPMAIFANPSRLQDVAQVEEIRALWGLDQPIHVKFVTYMKNMLTGQFGISYMSGDYVAAEVVERLSNTVLLVGVSTVLSIIIGIILGVIAARKRGSPIDSVLVISSLTTYSLPSFWLGMMLLLIFHYRLGWFPGVGTPPSHQLTRLQTYLHMFQTAFGTFSYQL